MAVSSCGSKTRIFECERYIHERKMTLFNLPEKCCIMIGSHLHGFIH